MQLFKNRFGVLPHSHYRHHEALTPKEQMHSAAEPIPSASPDDPKKQNLGSRDKSKSIAKDEDTAGIPPPAESSVYESSVFTDATSSTIFTI